MAGGGGDGGVVETRRGGGDQGEGMEAIAASASPRLKVLVVSPSAELRNSTVATLREAGHKVREGE